MAKKKIGILFGMEDTFPWALISAINALGGDEIEGAPVSISFLTETAGYDYEDFGKIVEVPTEALLDELLEFIDSVLDELGSRKEAQYISEILRNRTGADRQLQVYERTGSLPAVVDYIMQETESGIPL